MCVLVGYCETLKKCPNSDTHCQIECLNLNVSYIYIHVYHVSPISLISQSVSFRWKRKMLFFLFTPILIKNRILQPKSFTQFIEDNIYMLGYISDVYKICLCTYCMWKSLGIRLLQFSIVLLRTIYINTNIYTHTHTHITHSRHYKNWYSHFHLVHVQQFTPREKKHY